MLKTKTSPKIVRTVVTTSPRHNSNLDLEAKAANLLAAQKKSALDSVSVKMLLKWIQDAVESALTCHMFEPNDDQTRNSIAVQIEHALENSHVQDYVVVCDSSNNPQDSDSLCVDIAVRPVESMEFIYINGGRQKHVFSYIDEGMVK